MVPNGNLLKTYGAFRFRLHPAFRGAWNDATGGSGRVSTSLRFGKHSLEKVCERAARHIVAM